MIRKSLFITLLCLFASCSLAQVSPNLEQGLKPYGSFQDGNIDSVNLFNGNTTVHIPLVSYPQRGDLKMDFFIRYNDKQWQYRQFSTGTSGPLWGWYWVSGGVKVIKAQSRWSTNVIDRVTNNATGDLTYVHICQAMTPDGSGHQIQMASGSAFCGTRALDASGLTLTADPDGVTYSSSAVTDKNGNQIAIGSSGWTDTLGRYFPATTTPTDSEYAGYAGSTPVRDDGMYPGVPTSDLSNCPGSPVAARIWNLPGFGNNSSSSSTISQFKLCFSNFAYQTAFNNSNIYEASGTATLLSAVVLPNLTYWQFGYDNYLSLTNLQFPTGGSISYQYVNRPAGNSVSRSLTSRIVNANDGTGPHEWDYAYPLGYLGQTVVTAPADSSGVRNDTIHVFTNDYETQTRWYAGSYSSGTLLKTVDTAYPAWQENPYDEYGPTDGTSTYINVVPISTTTTWPNGKVSKTVRQYDAGTTWTFLMQILKFPTLTRFFTAAW